MSEKKHKKATGLKHEKLSKKKKKKTKKKSVEIVGSLSEQKYQEETMQQIHVEELNETNKEVDQQTGESDRLSYTESYGESQIEVHAYGHNNDIIIETNRESPVAQAVEEHHEELKDAKSNGTRYEDLEQTSGQIPETAYVVNYSESHEQPTEQITGLVHEKTEVQKDEVYIQNPNDLQRHPVLYGQRHDSHKPEQEQPSIDDPNDLQPETDYGEVLGPHVEEQNEEDSQRNRSSRHRGRIRDALSGQPYSNSPRQSLELSVENRHNPFVQRDKLYNMQPRKEHHKQRGKSTPLSHKEASEVKKGILCEPNTKVFGLNAKSLGLNADKKFPDTSRHRYEKATGHKYGKTVEQKHGKISSKKKERLALQLLSILEY